MVVYNLTNLTDAVDVVEMIAAINELSSGIIGLLILVVTFLIIFIAMKNFETKIVLLVDFFILTIISGLFYVIGFAGMLPFGICIAITLLLLVLNAVWKE